MYSTYGVKYFGRTSSFGSKIIYYNTVSKSQCLYVCFFTRKLVRGKLSKNTTTAIDGLIFMIANAQHLPTVMAISVIIMNQDPLCNIIGLKIASLLIMKVVRFFVLAVLANFVDLYINLVIMVYVLHISQLVQCGEVLLHWSLLQRRKFFQPRVIVSISYQMNTSYETYVKMQLVSNLMKSTYFYLSPLLLSIGGFVLVICNFACIRMYGSVDGLITIGFAGISFFILMIIIIVFPLAESIYENSVAFKLNMRSITRKDKLFNRKFASLRPCRMDFGLFFANKSTKCGYIDICFQNTVNALLLY